MGRCLWKRFCKLFCLIVIVWLICQKFGIDIIDWEGIENAIITVAPTAIIFIAIVYIIMNIFKG